MQVKYWHSNSICVSVNVPQQPHTISYTYTVGQSLVITITSVILVMMIVYSCAISIDNKGYGE